MPKENINYPLADAIISVVGSDEPVNDPQPAGPQVALHWDGNSGTVQLSMDIDIEVLERILDMKKNNPDTVWDGSELGRQIIYTEALTRADMQRLIKHGRRARDAAFGADE